MASSYSSVLLPEGTRAAVSGFNDRNEVLLLFPPVRPSELVEPDRELVQQRQNSGENSFVPLVLHTQRGVSPQAVPQKRVSTKVVPQICVTKPKPSSAHDNESTIIFPLGYSRPGALNALCLTSSWFIAFVKVTLNILMVIILSRAWISKCAVFIFWHYIL